MASRGYKKILDANFGDYSCKEYFQFTKFVAYWFASKTKNFVGISERFSVEVKKISVSLKASISIPDDFDISVNTEYPKMKPFVYLPFNFSISVKEIGAKKKSILRIPAYFIVEVSEFVLKEPEPIQEGDIPYQSKTFSVTDIGFAGDGHITKPEEPSKIPYQSKDYTAEEI